MQQNHNINLGFTANTSQARQEIQKLQTLLSEVANMPAAVSGNQFTTQIKQASLAAMELKTHLANATNVQTGTLDFSKLNSSIQASGISLSQYASKLLSVGPTGRQAFMQLASSVAQAEVPIRRSSAMLTSMMTTLKNTAKWQLASSAIHGFVGAISSAYNYAQDLDESLNNIRIVTEKSAAEMRKFAQTANEAARALNASTTEYTNASLIFYQQGLSDQQVKERTDVTIKMANVSRESAQTVSDQLTAIWNNFDNGSKSLEYYADVITALGAATASSSSEISDGLEKFASVAKTVGLSYEYATAALATVTATTRQSADVVGTAFKTLFARLQDLKLGETLDDGTTLGSYSENLAKVGVNIQDASGQLKDMDVILDELAAKWDTLDRGQQVALAKGVAGIRQYNTFLSLMSNWDFMEENLSTVAGSGGTLEKQAEIYGESWEAAQKRVKAAMESLYSNFIDPDFFIGLSKGIEKIVNVIDFLMDSLGGLSGVLATVSALLMRTFSDKIAASVRTVAHNIYASSQYGQQQIQQQKSNEISAMSTIMANTKTGTGDASIANKVAANQYSEQLKMQQRLIDNQTNMDEGQVSKCQQILDLRKQIADQIIAAAETEEAATTEIRNTYSEMLTQKERAAGRPLTGTDIAELRKHKNELQSAIQVQNNLEAAVREYQKALQENDAVTGDETADLEAQRAAAERLARARQNLHTVLTAQSSKKGLHMTEADARATINGIDASDPTGTSEALYAARAKAVKNVTNAQQTLINTDQVGVETVDRLTNSMRTANSAQTQRNNLTSVADDIQEEYNQSLDRGSNKNQDWAKSVTAGAQGVMSLVSAVQIASGLIDTLTNPDATGWEKFFAVLSSGAMIIMMVMSAMSSFAVMREMWQKGALKNAAATLLDMAATKMNTAAQKQNTRSRVENAVATDKSEKENYQHAASELADKAATDANNKSSKKNSFNQLLKGKKTPKTGGGEKSIGKLGQAFKNFGSSFKSFLGAYGAGIGLIAAGVAVAVGAIAWGINQFNKYENAAKEAAKQAEQAANAYKKVSETYEQFNSNLDAYKNAQEELKKLTKGTDEYRTAVLKANETTMQLLDSYEGLTYTIDNDGLIVIDEESLKEAQKFQEQTLKNAQMQKMVASQNAKDKQLEADKVQFQREELKSSEGTWKQVGNAAAATGAGALSGALIGAGIGSLGGPIGAAVGAAVGTAIGAITGIVGTIKAGAAAAEEEAALEKLAKVYQEQGNAKFATDEDFKKLLTEELKIDDQGLIDSLMTNREATMQLAKQMAEEDQQEDAQNTKFLLDAYKEQLKAEGLSDDEASRVAGVVGSEMQAEVDRLYEATYKDASGNLTDKEIQQQYAEAMGWDAEKTKNKSGNKATYYDKNGNVVAEDLDDDVARRFLATQAAIQSLETPLMDLGKKFTQLANSTDAADQAMANFIIDKNFNGMTQKEVSALQQKIGGEDGVVSQSEAKNYLVDQFGGGDGSLSDADAQKMGYSTAEEFIQVFYDGFQNFSKNLESAVEGFSQSTQSRLKQLNLDKLSVNDVNTIGNQLDRSTDEQASFLIDMYTKAGDEAGIVAQTIAKIDWSAASPSDLAKALEEAGVQTQFTTAELDGLAFTMQSTTLTTFDSISSKLAALDKLNDLNWGDTIDKGQFDTLTNEMQSYFTLMADGTYKLTGDAMKFYNLVNQEQATLRKEAIASNVAELDRKISAKETGTKKEIFDTKKVTVVDAPDETYEEYIANLGLRNETEYGEHGQILAYADYTFDWDNDLGATLQMANNWTAATNERGTEFIKNKKGETKYINSSGQEVYAFDNEWDYQQYIDNYESYVSQENMNNMKIKSDYLKTTDWYTENAENKKKLDEINEAIEANKATVEQYNYLVDVISGMHDQYETTMQEISNHTAEIIQNTADLIMNNAANAEERKALYEEELAKANSDYAKDAITTGYLQAQYAAMQEEAYEGLDLDEIDEYSRYLQEVENLTKDVADETARAIMKMNRGVETLNNNWEEWGSILKSLNKKNQDVKRSSQEYMKALTGTKKALSDVLDISEDFITIDFIENAENLKLIEKAAKGDADAIDTLGQKLARNIAENSIKDWLMSFSPEELNLEAQFDAFQKVKTLLDDIDGLLSTEMSKLDLGDTIQTGDLFNKLQEVVSASKMTVEQANAYYRSMGFTPKFKMVDIHQAESVPITTTFHKRTYPSDAFDENGNLVNWVDTEYSTTTQQSGGEVVSQIPSMAVGTPDGGSVQVPSPEVESLTYTGGGSYNNNSSQNTGGGGNGGGGGGSKKKADTVKKTDVVDRYKEITDALEDNAKAMDNASKAADGLYGAAKIKNMNTINNLLKKEIGLLNQKRKEALANLEIDRKDLETQAEKAGVHFNFDENGNISNYTNEMTALYEELDAAITQANKDGNATDAEQEKIDAIQEKIDNVKEAIDQYEETLDLLAELDQEEIDKFNQTLANNFEKLNLELELQIEFDEMDLSYIEYLLSEIEDDVFKQVEAIGYTADQFQTYGSMFENYEAHMKALEDAKAAGTISNASYVEGMKSINEAMLDQLSSLQSLKETMEDYYGNTIALAQEEIAKYTDLMENAASVLDHYNSLMELTGKNKDYQMMNDLLRAQADVAEDAYRTSQATYNMFKMQAEDRKEKYERGKNGPNADILKQQWLDAENAAAEAQDQMLSDAEAWAESMQAILDNSLAKFADELEDALTGNFGSFEALNTAMERKNSLQEEFLTTTNKIYETNKMMRNAQKEIDKTTNQMAKQRLKQFINETAAMQEQEQLSQYELEVQQAKYDLLLAEIALKEAQNAKSTVRLQRDSEGNFGYVYTANQDAIADAQQKFEDSQNALYNKGLEGANNYAQKYADIMSEMNDAMTEINQKWRDGEYETEEEYNKARQAAEEYYYSQLKNYSGLYQYALTVDSRVATDSWATSFGEMTTQTETWMKNIKDYMDKTKEAFNEYSSVMDKIAEETVGKDLDALKEKTSAVTKESERLRKMLIGENGNGGLVSELSTKLGEVLEEITKKYINQRKAIDDLIDSMKRMAEQAAANAENTAYDEFDVSPGSQVTVKSGVTGWVTDGDKGKENMGSVKGGQGYTVIRWDEGKKNVLISDGAGNYGWIAVKDLVGFQGANEDTASYDTGGYTGSWGSYGKLAMLHEKELVLNAADTENLLASMEFLNKILEIIDLQAISAQVGGILSSPSMTNNATSTIEQNVHIEASFPNATNHSEIEEAFNNLINISSQYANRK